jgi:transposase
MDHPPYTVGIDVSSEHFTATIMDTSFKVIAASSDFANNPDGFSAFATWLSQNTVTNHNAVICLEATGVYGESLCYALASNSFQLALEHPLKVKRAFQLSTHKTDSVDSRQIAEYAHRFFDELAFWQPKTEVIEHIKTLLTTRDHLSRHLVSHQNATHMLKRKHIHTPLAEKTHTDLITDLKKRIANLDEEIKKLIDQDASLQTMTTLIISIPGVGLSLAAHLICLTKGFSKVITARQLAAYIGVCPYKHSSGKSVLKKPHSRGAGPSAFRKLLYLASLSLRTHNAQFKHYFFRKLNEGKPKRLILNNIENKLIKIICAVIQSKKEYIPNFKSVKPVLLK